MTRKSVPLAVEELGDRVVPSAAPAVDPVMTHPIVIAQSVHPLTGRGAGDYHSHRGNPDTGVTHKVNGGANLQGMGKVTLTGEIHAPGFIHSTTFTGTMTFKTARGKVTVELASFRPAGPAGLPVWYRYHVTQATGAFKGMHDSGSLRLDVQLFPSFAAGPDQAGTFRVTI
jgi:hypothetical protein